MKYMIEFELPDNDTVLREIKTMDVAWGIWGYSGCTKAKPVQRWIPCSERLPKVRQDVLMQFEQNIAVGFLSHGNWNVNTGNGLYTAILESDDQPIAWMPSPWEGGQE